LTKFNSALIEHYTGYAGGRFLPSAGKSTFKVIDPASQEILAELPSFGGSETLAAVESAVPVLEDPAPFETRARWLTEIARAHVDNRDELGRIVTLENGKPLAEAKGEIDYAAAFYRDAAQRLEVLRPRKLKERPKGLDWTVYSRPAGVAGLITPWNFPVAMLAKKLSGAIAAGAPAVVKPAEKTPLSCIALFHLLHRLGLPPGMVNLVFGDAPAIGRVLCEHPAVRVLSFTGSTAVGKLLSAQAAPHLKRMSLELGGNAPFIVFDDADLDLAADQLMTSKFRATGQTCVCANRVFVQDSIAAAFTDRVVERVRALQVGHGLEEGVTVGPLIDLAAFQKVSSLVDDALGAGAQALTGGRTPPPAPDKGCFFPPTVLTGVRKGMRILGEEAFGPTVPIARFTEESEIVRIANDTEYGLAAYVFTRDPARAERVISRLRFGHVGLNSGTGPTPEAPFGGMKHSGLGREGGEEGLLEYVELQTVPHP
jgi:succinate-semialdehyde dehydrogenase/glutarate-semialdehyde dehydrogenase